MARGERKESNMILLCGECKQWQAEAIRRIGHSRCGICTVKGARTTRVHICNVLKDKAVVAENRVDINRENKLQSRPDPQYGRMYEAAVLLELGFSTPEIAQRMRIRSQTVTKYISKYRRLKEEARHEHRTSTAEV